jgi:hypothetical protein
MPLLFEIYYRGRRLTDYRPRAAHVVGPESIPVPGRIAFEEGLLRVEAGNGLDIYRDSADPGDEVEAYTGLPDVDTAAVGVAMLWDGGPGAYILETCRLPCRPEPYVLNVELARHRLMRLMQKQEDWNLWELPQAALAVARARAATRAFAEALAVLHDPPVAAEKADAALAMALDVGEELALVHGELMLKRRRKVGMPRNPVSVRADTSADAPRNATYRTALVRGFDGVSLATPWRQMQPEQESFVTRPVDTVLEFLARNSVPMVAGPLVDLGEGEVPEWLFIYEHDFETLRDLAFEFVRSLVSRYRRVVKVWNVVTGLHAAGGFGLTLDQMIELTRLLVGQVKAVLPAARAIVGVRQPFGEYLASTEDASVSSQATSPMMYAEMVSQSGVQVDGFGVELVMGAGRQGRYCRDLFQISAMLDRFANLGKPLFVTATACPDAGGDEAGRWHEPWSPQLQARWLRDVMRLCLSKPYVENVAWADLADGNESVMPGSGLLDDLFKPKPAWDAVQEVRSRFSPQVLARMKA